MSSTTDVWIIGASKGLGLAIAEEFARDGRPVIGLARSTPAEQGPFAAFRPVDVTSGESVERTVRTLLAERGAPALIVYCASQLYQGSIATRDDAELDRELEVNYLGFVRVARALAVFKDPAARVRLVATGSTLGYVGTPSLDNYSAAKAALISFARSSRHELGALGIDVAIVSPPHMDNGADLVGPKRYAMSWAAPRFASAAAGERDEYLLGASNRSIQQMTHWAPGLAQSIMRGIGADALARGASTVRA